MGTRTRTFVHGVNCRRRETDVACGRSMGREQGRRGLENSTARQHSMSLRTLFCHAALELHFLISHCPHLVIRHSHKEDRHNSAKTEIFKGNSCDNRNFFVSIVIEVPD